VRKRTISRIVDATGEAFMTGEGRRIVPRRRQGLKIIFELTNLCNFSCTHCIRSEDGGKSYLSLDIVDTVLEQVERYEAVDTVAFTGGEPTLHPQFDLIVQKVVDAGYRFNFVTNAWSFTRTLEILLPVKEHVQAVSFSLDGASEEIHDGIRRRPGSYRRVMQGITLCHHHGLNAQINMTVTTSNRHEVQEMALLAARLGLAGVGYAHCQPTPDGLHAGLVMNASERLELEAEIADLQRMMRIPLFLAGDHHDRSPVFQCQQLLMREFNVDYRGCLTACCTLSNYRGGKEDTDVIADLNEVSFYEAHRRLAAKVAEINALKIRSVERGSVTDVDRFICSACLKHYEKVPDLDTILS
jgi:MoaA/NifB/PqqE/SkfB family radical SAM enzyme